MFDFGFSELLVVALVALIVVGPERLPKVARTAGHLLGRLQRYVSDVKSDISREMQLEDLKKLQQQVEQQARDLETSVRTQVQGLETDMNQSASGIKRELSIDEIRKAAPDGTSREPGAPVADASAQEPPSAGSTGHPPQLELGLDPSSDAGRTAEKP
ncbi:MAG: Sec-independent protein translocase protein TatB [Rhodocyclaceae bacterium]|jgi:sec-independent protein translocase protein TatB|nr:twin-arginine translocase subunit TatB [Rhodocyclaceae bacterium]MCL4756801.1 Sec-independent protein translocase protein TatB [Rhodocyclaceae bacterium]